MTLYLKIGHLQIMQSRLDPGLYIDWRLREPGRRWRIQVSRQRTWFERWSKPTYRGRYVAFWGYRNQSDILDK